MDHANGMGRQKFLASPAPLPCIERVGAVAVGAADQSKGKHWIE